MKSSTRENIAAAMDVIHTPYLFCSFFMSFVTANCYCNLFVHVYSIYIHFMSSPDKTNVIFATLGYKSDILYKAENRGNAFE